MRRTLRRLAMPAASLCAAWAVVPASAATPTPAPASPSAVGSETVPAVSVSPAYARTGFALAMSYTSGGSCSNDCVHLWSTHDRGATWSRLPASGWQHGTPQIALGPGGREVVLAGGGAVQRSDDGGATWRTAGPQGAPAAGPPFAADGTLVIAGEGAHDVLVRSSGATADVPGSGGTFTDAEFAYAPSFPSASRYAPVLLSAVDTGSKTAVVEQCTVSYACSSPVVLPSKEKLAPTATLVMSPGWADDGTVFAVEPTALLRSTDGGRTFTALSIGRPGALATSVGSLVLDSDFTRNHTVYAAVLQIFAGRAATAGGVYRSTDAGSTWTAVGSPGPLDHGATTVAAAPGGRLFAGYMDQSSGAARAGLVCWDGAAWTADCGAHGAPSRSGRAPVGASTGGATPCGGCAGGVAGGAASGTGAAGGAAAGGDAGGAEPTGALATTPATGGHGSAVLPVAVALLVILGMGSLVARLRERRRSARRAS